MDQPFDSFIRRALASVFRSLDAHSPAPPAAPAAAPAGPQWQAMPGCRLELGASGYWIQLDPARGEGCLFTLVNPEGERLMWGPNLQYLKSFAEGQAASRAEFYPAHLQKDGHA